jgi:hypothetical protein
LLKHPPSNYLEALFYNCKFIRSKATVVTPDLLASSTVGKKDIQRNLFDIWKDLFQTKDNAISKKKALQRIINTKKQEDTTLLG